MLILISLFTLVFLFVRESVGYPGQDYEANHWFNQSRRSATLFVRSIGRKKITCIPCGWVTLSNSLDDTDKWADGQTARQNWF